MITRFTIMCVASLLDSRSNNVSLIEVIEELQVGALPNSIGFHVVCLFEKEVGDPEITEDVALKVVMDGVELRVVPLTVNFAGEARSRIFIEVGSLHLVTAGRLEVKVLFGEKQIGGWWANVTTVGRTGRKLH